MTKLAKRTESLPEFGTTSYCGGVCDGVASKHHEVIVWLAHGSDDSGKPLDMGPAWSKVYDAKGKSASNSCSRMLDDVGNLKCLQHHRALVLQQTVGWLERKSRLRARARLFDVTEYGEPDPDAFEDFKTAFFRGVENRRSTETEEVVLYEDKLGTVTTTIPRGRAKASFSQLIGKLMRVFDFRTKPTAEWDEASQEALDGWMETKLGKMIPVFNRGQWANLSAKLEGLITERRILQVESEKQLTEQARRTVEVDRAEIPSLVADPVAWLEDARQRLVDGATTDEERELFSTVESYEEAMFHLRRRRWRE